MSAKTPIKFPFVIEDLEHSLNADILKVFKGTREGLVKVGPKSYVYPKNYEKFAADIYNAPIGDRDVWVVGFPRSGTTWTRELIWLINNDLDYKRAAETPLDERFGYFEQVLIDRTRLKTNTEYQKRFKDELLKKCIERHSQQTDISYPRFFFSHLPLSLLPQNLLEKAKVVVIARDPRDVVVSYYLLNRSVSLCDYTGDFKTFWNYFINDLVFYTPFFGLIKEAWGKRHHPNMLFLFYEELIKDLPGVMKRASDFFDKNMDQNQIALLCEHLSFDNFKKNKSVNGQHFRDIGIMQKGDTSFVRKGKTGGWREYFDEEMTLEAERWMEKNLRDTDLRFPPT